MSEKLPNDSQDDSRPNSGTSRSGRGFDKSKLGGIAVIALIVVYSLSAPRLNARYGWNLPQIQTDSDGNVSLAKSEPKAEKNLASKESPVVRADSPPSKQQDSFKEKSNASGAAKSSSPGANERDKGPLASRMRPSSRSTDPPARGPPSQSKSSQSKSSQSKSSQSKSSQSKSKADSSNSDLLYGLLRETSPERFISPEGLQYTPGSAEGHRLEHLRRHTKDDPGRPGSHGVFDGEMEGALKTIDRAYQRAKTGQRTTKKVDDGRTIYTVDMGGRVGFVGGRDGGRKRNPMARRVRIVLEGNRVITAYPM